MKITWYDGHVTLSATSPAEAVQLIRLESRVKDDGFVAKSNMLSDRPFPDEEVRLSLPLMKIEPKAGS